MIRSFQIIGGFEVTNIMRHFIASGYIMPEQILEDLEIAKQHVLAQMNLQKKEQLRQQTPQETKVSEKFDIDAFLDAINREKNQGQ